MSKATKQMAVVAALKLAGLAVIQEIAADYLVFRANGLAAIDAALVIADELEATYGIPVAIQY